MHGVCWRQVGSPPQVFAIQVASVPQMFNVQEGLAPQTVLEQVQAGLVAPSPAGDKSEQSPVTELLIGPLFESPIPQKHSSATALASCSIATPEYAVW